MKANRTALAGLLAFVLTGCMGVGTPIGARFVKGDSQALDAGYYGDPLKIAFARVNEWDDAIQNIQRGNTGAIGALTAVNGALVYRAARNKAGAATALLATGGLIGMSLSDALVQVSRLGTYENGISAMECAIYAYRGAGGRSAPPSKAVDDAFELVEQRLAGGALRADVLEIRRKLEVADATRRRQRDEAFGRTVSRITHEVHQALIGSIVTLQSRESAWSFDVPKAAPVAVDDLAEPTQKLLQNLRGGMGGASGKVAQYAGKRGTPPGVAGDEAFVQALTTIFEALVAELEVSPDPTYEQKLDACSIATPVATARGMTWVPLSVVAVDASEPMNVARSASAAAVVSGGFPPYTVAIAESGDTGVTAAMSTAGGANVVTVTATSKPKAGDTFTAIVTDAAHVTAKLRIKIK